MAAVTPEMVPSFPATQPPDTRGGRLAEPLKVGEIGGPFVAVLVAAINFARVELMLVFTRGTAR